MPEDIKPVGKLTPYNPPTSNGKSIKPVGELSPVGELVPVGTIEQPRINDFGTINEKEDNIESTLDFVQNKMPGLKDMRDDEKDILRDIMKNPKATKEDISNAIRTFKGVHAEQVYNKKGIGGTADYYMDMDEKGLYKPIPLGQNKPLPAGKNIASVWGTGGEETQDDSWYTDLAKKAFNIIPSTMEGVTDLFVAGSSALRGVGTAIEGKEYEKSTATGAGEEAKKFFQQFKIPTSDEYNQSIYDAEGIKSFSDLISKDRVNLNLKNVYGTISNLAGSVAEMYLTGGAAAEGMLAKKALTGLSGAKGVAPALNKAEKYASVYTGTFISNLGDAMDAAKKAGISEEDAGGWAMAVTIPIAALDAGTGIGGKLLMNKLVNEGKKDFFGKMASKVVLDEFGNVTEESLKKASAEAAMAYAPVAKGFLSTVKLTGKDALVQGGEEAVQSFISSAGEQLYDKLSDADKVKFGTDAFSAESIGKYISEGVAGLVGAGPLAVKTAKIKQQENYKAQSNSAYETVMQGEDAVKAFKTNATNAFREGKISKEDYDNAILKVDSYDSYEKTTKDLTLDNENKKKLFELSLQKENLKAAIKDAEAKDTEGHSRLDKMNPAELGLHNAKVKQAKALQDEIDLIVSKSEVLQQPEVAEKVVEKVVKAEEKATEGTKVKEGVSSEIGAILGRQYKVKAPIGAEVAVPGKAAYEVPKKVAEETRKMKEIPAEEWNQPNFDVTVKQAKLAEALDEAPEKTTTGTLQIDNEFTDDKGRQVQTFNITLPNGKAARFASSMVRFPEENAAGGFRGNTYEENLTNKENPVGQKLGATVRTLKDSGRKVIFVWNADEGPKFGKHIGMVKERLRGKSDYSEADIEEMADLRMINMGQNPNAPAPGIITPEGPTKGGAPKVATPVKNKEVKDKLKGLGYSKPEIQAMEPQEANDIVKEKREKSKVKKQPLEEVEIKEKKKGKIVVKKAPKEVVVEKEESIAKRKALMESILGASKLVAAYNNLTKVQKRSKVGVDLYKKIQDRVKEIGYTTTISRGGTLQLMGEKGKRVYKTPVKRTEDQKAIEKEKKEALGAEPTSIRHAVILDIANGAQFNVDSLADYFSEKILKNEMPSLLKNNKKGIKVGSYKTNYEEAFGQFEIENITEADAAAEAATTLGDYFMDGFREAAIQDAIDINFKTKNEGRSRSQVEDLNEMQKEQEREQKELEDVLAQEDLEKEEYRKQAEQEDARLRLPKIEEKPTEALKDVESTTTALSNAYYEQQKYDEYKEIKKIAKLEDAETFTDISEAYHKAKKDGSNPELVKAVESLLNKPKEGYLQKAKVKPATLNKFEKSVDLFYKTKDADGASKKRSLAAERREFLEKNPTVKYIDDNMKYIYKQLEEQNIIERKGECP